MSEVKAGQIWRSDSADAFFLVTEDGGNYYVFTHQVGPHPDDGHWHPEDMAFHHRHGCVGRRTARGAFGIAQQG